MDQGWLRSITEKSIFYEQFDIYIFDILIKNSSEKSTLK